MEYETTEQAAQRLGLTPSRIRQMCQHEWIKGAKKVGVGNRSNWLVPKDAQPVKPKEEK